MITPLSSRLFRPNIFASVKYFSSTFSQHSFSAIKPNVASKAFNRIAVYNRLSTQAPLAQESTNDPIKEPNEHYMEMVEKSLTEKDYFDVHKLVTLQDLFDNRCYLGHKEGTLNHHMKPYIFGSRLGHLIIDIEQSVGLLQEALNFTAHIAFRNGIILFINKSPTTGHIVEQTALNCGEYSHCRDWKLGTFTDSVKFFESFTRLPDLLIFLNTMGSIFQTHTAVMEAAKHMIPTIGVVDTNCNPCLITYPVPGNDDSLQSIQYYCELFEKAIKAGKQKRLEALRSNEKI